MYKIVKGIFIITVLLLGVTAGAFALFSDSVHMTFGIT